MRRAQLRGNILDMRPKVNALAGTRWFRQGAMRGLFAFDLPSLSPKRSGSLAPSGAVAITPADRHPFADIHSAGDGLSVGALERQPQELGFHRSGEVAEWLKAPHSK